MGQKKLYTISLNLDREKHKDLIAWLKSLAIEDDRSLSYTCIRLLKTLQKEQCNGNDE